MLPGTPEGVAPGLDDAFLTHSFLYDLTRPGLVTPGFKKVASVTHLVYGTNLSCLSTSLSVLTL